MGIEEGRKEKKKKEKYMKGAGGPKATGA